jgi:hypothetical protein
MPAKKKLVKKVGTSKPTFQPLSELLKAWGEYNPDKKNCLFCPAPATRAAVLGRSEIRCCGSEKCGIAAIFLAEYSEKSLAEHEL